MRSSTIGLVLVAQRVARGGVAQPDRRGDVAGVDLLDVLALVRVHLEEPADALLLALHRVVDVRPGGQHARVHAQEGQRADVRVGHDLERQRRERLGVVRAVRCRSLPVVRVDPLHRRHVGRRRQQLDDGVEQCLHALVLEGRPTEHRHDLHGERTLAQRRG
jgi:hypothetical protein